MAVIAVMMFRFVEPHAMESDLYRDLAPVAPVAPVAPDLGLDLTWDLHLSYLSSGLVSYSVLLTIFRFKSCSLSSCFMRSGTFGSM